jgi:hypothetical protein
MPPQHSRRENTAHAFVVIVGGVPMSDSVPIVELPLFHDFAADAAARRLDVFIPGRRTIQTICTRRALSSIRTATKWRLRIAELPKTES